MSTDKLKDAMQVGKVYRRCDLKAFSTAVDRDLKKLETTGKVVKVGPGLYQRPKVSTFGALPPSEKDLVKSFLKDDRFLLSSFNHYNALGLGLTQLYNSTLVYNKKRHEKVMLGGYTFDFRRPVDFPRKLTKEFLLVDLMNNLRELAEDSEQVKRRVVVKAREFDRETLLSAAEKFGKLQTKKFFATTLEKAA